MCQEKKAGHQVEAQLRSKFNLEHFDTFFKEYGDIMTISVKLNWSQHFKQ